ncbi:MAG TPA: transcription-repair coupling factor, partial [Leucothrix mucor]|nr:transcription-repair coupling factor [Leucothrix mucor]
MSLTTLNPLYPDKQSNNHNALCWGQLHGCSQDLLIANASSEFKGLIVLVTPDSQSAYEAETNIRFFCSELNTQKSESAIHIFPDWETLPYDVFSPHEDLISDRLKTLHQLSHIKNGVLIVPVATLMQKLAPVDYIRNNTLILNVGDSLEIDTMRQQLESSGYRHVTQVMEHGEYSTRGSLIDLFPMGSNTPFRIDLFGDEIETIRSFNPEDQRTIEQLNKIELLPAHEYPLTPDGISLFKENYSTQIGGDLAHSQIYDNVVNGNPPTGIEYYLPLFFKSTATLFDYLPEKVLLINAEGTQAAAETFYATVMDRHEQRRHDLERPILAPELLYLNSDQLLSKIEGMRRINTHSFKQTKNCHNYPVNTLPSLLIQARAETPLMLLKQFLQQIQIHEQRGRILFTADSAGRRENLIGLLRDNGFTTHTTDNWHSFI